VRGAYCIATIRAEVVRARKASRDIDRMTLRDETGLSWHRIESLIASISKELNESEGQPAEAPPSPFPAIKFWPADWAGHP